ncbi:MAG: hypothetical protein WCZ27_05800 [Tissierellaceae bacterium]
MKKIIKNLIIGFSMTAIIFMGAIAFTEPGSQMDPLVTLSYVDMKIDQLKTYIDSKVNKESADQEEGAWKVVEVQEGQSLMCYGGTEIILRSGKAKAVSIFVGDIENGLTDITLGRDLKMDENIEENHLLIIPRTDSRGAYAVTDTFWLVKGDYKIK